MMIPIPADQAAKAAATDILRLDGVDAGFGVRTPTVYEKKATLEKIVINLLNRTHTMLVGPTGTGKSAIWGALLVGGWLQKLSAAMGFGTLPSTRIFPVEVSHYDAGGELFRRRGLEIVDGASRTVWESGVVVDGFRYAVDCAAKKEKIVVFWLKELSQATSPSIYGALLEVIADGPVHLGPDELAPGNSVTFVADSNWGAAGQYNNQELSDALQRRFVSVYLDYHSPETEEAVLRDMTRRGVFVPYLAKRVSVATDSISAMVAMGQEIRRQKEEGYLKSVPQVSYKTYQNVLAVQAARQCSIEDAVVDVMFSGASPVDQDAVATSLASVFGQTDDLMGVF